MRKILIVIAATAAIFSAGALAGYGGSALLHWWRTPAPLAQGDYSSLLRRAEAPTVLFSLSTCPYCKQARAWLVAHQVPFEELLVDQDTSAKRLFDELNEPGLPVWITEERLVRGFDSDAYAAAAIPRAAPVSATAMASR